MVKIYDKNTKDIETVSNDLFYSEKNHIENLKKFISNFEEQEFPIVYSLNPNEKTKYNLRRLIRKLTYWFIKPIEKHSRTQLDYLKKILSEIVALLVMLEKENRDLHKEIKNLKQLIKTNEAIKKN